MSQDLVSFVLRFVREASEDQQARWRGIITHVQSQSEDSFTQFSEALAFMQEHVYEVAQSSFEQSEQAGSDMSGVNPITETARMWGEFVPQYTQMMMDSMSEAMTASSTMVRESSSSNLFTDQMEQMEKTMSSAFGLWGIPTKGETQMNNQDNPFQKNVELWQQFSDSYTKNMFSMFERNLAQSKAFQEQVQSAVSESVDNQFELILSNLKMVEDQISQLSESVSEMAAEKATEE